MELRQIFASKIILSSILLLFATKGLVLSFLIPIFQNPDEQVHYGTVQQWAAPEEEKSMKRSLAKQPSIDGNDIRTSNLPEETVQSAYLGKFDEIKFEKQNIQDFSNSGTENEIIGNDWNRYVDTEPTAVSRTKSIYYLVASWLERIFSGESIFIRIFSSRMLAVAFGVATVLLAYMIARKVGFSDRISLLLTTLVAFQPMFSITAAQVNIDIALIFAFTLFLYAGVAFLQSVDSSTRKLTWNDKAAEGARETGFFASLRMTGKWVGMTESATDMTKWAVLAVFAAVLGFFSKGPGVVLVAALFPLFVWGAYKHIIPSSSKNPGVLRFAQNDKESGENDKKKRFFAYLALATIMMASLAFLAVPKSYLIGITNLNANSKFDSPLESIGKYLDKTTDTGEFRDTALSYWGNFGWLDTPISERILSVISWIEIIGFVAVLMYLLLPFLKRVIPSSSRNPGVLRFAQNDKEGDQVGWIPDRKYLVFFLGMILTLQFAIRFYDWRVFDTTGQILIGQPGRYFLPNIIGHLILVSVGVGLAVSWVWQLVIPSSLTGVCQLSRNLGWARSLVIRKQGRDPSTSLGMTEESWVTTVPSQGGIPRNDKADFELVMKMLALGMILLQLHAIVNVIIPRYYL